MELCGFYAKIRTALSVTKLDYWTAVIVAGSVALAIWLTLFILQGIGLFVMAKKRKMKNKWLAFMPFANIMYMGKLAGTCSFFGQKMKRAGLYTMLAQIFGTLLLFATVFAEIYLNLKYEGYSNISNDFPYNKLVGFDALLRDFLGYANISG